MPITIPLSNLPDPPWNKGAGPNWYLPKPGGDPDGNNHVHVAGSVNGSNVTVASVSVKIAGANRNLRPGNAIRGFQFIEDPGSNVFPPGADGEHYRAALRAAGLLA